MKIIAPYLCCILFLYSEENFLKIFNFFLLTMNFQRIGFNETRFFFLFELSRLKLYNSQVTRGYLFIYLYTNTLMDIWLYVAVHQGSIGSESFRFGKTDGLQNVTVQVGSSAYLHCPVINLGEKEVNSMVLFNYYHFFKNFREYIILDKVIWLWEKEGQIYISDILWHFFSRKHMSNFISRV